MGGELIGLVAVTLGMGVPLGALYTYYREIGRAHV